MYLRPHTTLKIGFKELVFDFRKSVSVFFLTMLLLWVFYPKSYLDVFARVLSWNGVLIFAPSPSLLKDEGRKVRMKDRVKRVDKLLHRQKFFVIVRARIFR